tara:strand:+ start:226 stop:534 length:309 start_codon:yes stop_codon:yes gene_type:complete
MVFDWLKNKIEKSESKEFDKGCHRTLNFLNYAKSRDDAQPGDIADIELYISEINNLIKNIKKNDSVDKDSMDKLLEIDMICRRIWANAFQESNFTYDKKFNP